MASVYPNALDALVTTKNDATGQQTDHAAHHNNLADAVNKIEAELGVTPSSAFETVAARLLDIETDYQQENEKGIAGGYASLDGGGKVPVAQLPVSGTPAGVVEMYAGPVVPSGYLYCDGAAVSRATYVALFTAIGGYWGSGDGSTTFNLPDFRGRVPVGTNPGGPALIDGLGDNDGRAQAVRNISHFHNTAHAVGADVGGGVWLFTNDAQAANQNFPSSGDGNNQDYPAFNALHYIIKT